MGRVVIGNGQEFDFLTKTVTDTTPAVAGPMDLAEGDWVGVQLVTTGLSGSWKIEVSNDFVAPLNNAYGQAQTTGTFSDITAAFTPVIVAVVSGVSGENQFVQASVCARCIRYTFTPTSGSGTVRAIGIVKSLS